MSSADDGRPYYYRVRGRTLGPYDLRQMRQKAGAAQVNHRTDVSRDAVDWAKGSDYPEIFVRDNDRAESKWFYSMNGVTQGPVDLAKLQQLVVGRLLGPQDLVMKEGDASWVSVQATPELVMFLPPDPTLPPIGETQTITPPPPIIINNGDSSQTNGMAIAGFVLSLLGCTCLTALLGFIFSMVALNSTNRANRGLAIAGAIIGGLWMLAYVAYFVLVVVFAAAANAHP